MAKNKKVIKEQKKYHNLQERYDEMNNYLLDLIQDHRCAEEELRHLNDFIHYKELDDEFHYFREHAMRTKTRNFRFHISRYNN